MTDLVTREQLQNAALDAISLADVVNEADSVVVVTRTGRSLHTLAWIANLAAGALATVISYAGLAPGWAPTLALAKTLYTAPTVLADGQIMHVAGRLADNDGYGGAFIYKSGDSTTTFTLDALGFVDGQSRRWFRQYDQGLLNAMWYGCKRDGSTNDYAALQACFTAAVALSQTGVVVPSGVFALSQTLNTSNVSWSGAGALSTTFKALEPFTGDSILLFDDTTGGGGGVDFFVSNFQINGNEAVVTTTVAGMKLYGNVLYGNFANIKMINTADGVVCEGKTGPTYRPTNIDMTNIRVGSGTGDGFKIKAGRNITFNVCAAELMDGKGFNISSATEACDKLTLVTPYIENVDGDAIYCNNSSDVHIDRPQCNGYGVSGSASYAVRFTGSGSVCNKLSGGTYNKVASPHADSKHILIDDGERYILENLPSSINAANLSISGERGVTINGCYNVGNQSVTDIPFSNTDATVAASTTVYLAPNGCGQSATATDVRMKSKGYKHISGLSGDFTVNAGGSATYTVTLMRDDLAGGGLVATAVSGVTAAGGGSITNNSNEVLIRPGEFYCIKLVSSAGATLIPKYGAHITIGERK